MIEKGSASALAVDVVGAATAGDGITERTGAARCVTPAGVATGSGLISLQPVFQTFSTSPKAPFSPVILAPGQRL